MQSTPRPREHEFEVPMPWKGIDLSQPRTNPDRRTCLTSVNMRSFHPQGDRHGMGARGGSRKASDTQFLSDGAGVYGPTVYRRVIGLETRQIAKTLGAASGQSQFIRPDSTISGAGAFQWAPVGDVTLHQCIDEVVPDDNTTYIISGVGINGVCTCRVGTTNPTFGAVIPANTGVIARFRFLQPDPSPAGGGSINEDSVDLETRAGKGGVLDGQSQGIRMRVYVNTGNVLIAQTDVIIPPTFDEWHTVALVLTPAQIAAITDATDLALEFEVADPALLETQPIHVTWSEIEFIPQSQDPSDWEPEALIIVRGSAWMLNLRSGVPSARASVGAAGLLSARLPSIALWKQRFYVVDGDDQDPARGANTARGVIINPATNPPTITTWDPVALIRACRLNAVFRRRMVLARQEGASPNPAAYYLSAIDPPGDPAAAGGLNTAAAWAVGLDEDRPGETSAIAGTNKPVGGPEDMVTALIPWHEDYLLFGGAHTVNIMAGDPGYRGTFVNLTRKTGIVQQRAWCFGHGVMSNGDEREVLYFLGSSGLYMLDPPNKPRNISGRRLYRHLERIDPSKVQIELRYDAFKKEVQIYITPHTPPQQNQGYPADDFTRDIIYDVVNDAFHFDSHRWSTMGVWSACEINGQSDDERRILFGGNDGYVRRWFEGGVLGGAQRYGTADDMAFNGTGGEPVLARVRLHPFRLPRRRWEYTARELAVIGSDTNPPLSLPPGPVNWYWICGTSPVEAAETHHAAARRTGTWNFSPTAFGAMPSVGIDETAAGHQLQIEQSSATAKFGIDEIVVRFEEAGPLRL